MKLFNGYGPYKVEVDGSPNFSDVVWDMLSRNDVSAEEFGIRLGRLTRTNRKPYTKSRVYQMLRNNDFPTDEKRRWVIATLLRIPPILMGAHSLDELLSTVEEQTPQPIQAVPHHFSTEQSFTFDEYSHALKTYWKQNRAHSLSSLHVEEIEIRIRHIEWETLYGSHTPKKQIIQLLCGYHMLRANIARDLQDAETAIIQMNKAYTLAKDNSLHKLQAAILCRRGGVFKERGEDLASVHDFDAAGRDFAFATDDYTLALTLDKKIAPGVQGSILLSLGKLKADQAQNPGALHQAIKEIDTVESFVGKKADRDNFDFVEVDEERYYLNRAAAYLVSPVTIACYPQDARRELRNAMAVQPSPPPRRRQAHNMILVQPGGNNEGV